MESGFCKDYGIQLYKHNPPNKTVDLYEWRVNANKSVGLCKLLCMNSGTSIKWKLCIQTNIGFCSAKIQTMIQTLPNSILTKMSYSAAAVLDVTCGLSAH